MNRTNPAPPPLPGAGLASRKMDGKSSADGSQTPSTPKPFDELLSQLQRRLALLRAISASLEQSREAILRLDSDNMLKTAAEQQSLCTELRQLQASLIDASGRPTSKVQRGSTTVVTLRLSPAELQRAGALRRELADAEREVRNAARMNAALLRRSGQTASSLRNLYLSFVGTYSNPFSSGTAGNNRP